MRKGIKKKLENKTFSNGVWVYIFQFINLVIPMLSIPYVTRVIGKENYGVFSSAFNIITYFNVIVAYGFDLIGAKKISIAKDENEINEIYSTIFFIKMTLYVISLLALQLLLFFGSFSMQSIIIMNILFLIVLGTMLQQSWLFQGLQKVKFLTIINGCSKLLSLLFIFVFINKSEQVVLYSLIYALSFLGTGLVSYFIIKYKLSIKIIKISKKKVKDYMYEGLPTFFTAAASSLYTGIGVTSLSVYHEDAVIGEFTAIQKIPQIIVSLISPIFTVLFPYVTQKYINSFSEGYNFVKKVIKIVMPIVIVIFMILSILSSTAVKIILGDSYIDFHYAILPLSLWSIFAILNNFLGIQILVASGHQNSYGKAFIIGVIIIIPSSFIVSYLFSAIGIAYLQFFVEVVLSLFLCIYIRKVIKNEKSDGSIRD